MNALMSTPPLLAFGFANPLILWGLAAASLPILLHLLNRRRYREQSWAAMRFLLAAIRKNQRRIRLEHWLLLAVRTLLVVCLVLAMAQPFLESIGPVPLLASRRTHRVVVVDASMSMNYATAERSRFRRAIDYADAYIRGARGGDAISLVTLADPPRVVIGAPSPNHEEVLQELRDLRPTDGRADLSASVSKLLEVLESSSLPQSEVLFLTDLQAATWRAEDGQDAPIRRSVEELERVGANCVVVDVGDVGGANQAVVDLDLGSPIVVRDGPPTFITARLKNFGSEPRASLRTRLVVDGRLGPERTVDLGPGEEAPIAFTHRFDEAGDHVVEVRLEPDSLDVDDSRRLAVPVREHLEVLLVDGDFDPEPFESETDYLSQALSPSEGSDQTPSPIRVEVVTDSQLSRRDLERFDVVFLCNVASISPTERQSLDRFLRSGGGLVVFGGDRVRRESYNATLFQEGDGLLPAELEEVVDAGPVEDSEAALARAPQFDPLEFEHPIVSPYQGAGEMVLAGLTSVRTWRSHTLRIPEDSPVRLALRFTDGRPAVVTKPRHRGVVVLVATSADDDWSSWPLHPSYPPIMEQIAIFAASGRTTQRTVRVGQPIDGPLPPEATSTTVVVESPDGRDQPGRVLGSGDDLRFVFEQTDLAGTYRARLGSPVGRTITFAANPAPSESDLARADSSELAARFPAWKFTAWEGGPVDRTTAAGVGRRGELHRGLLWAVLALLLGESALAWRIGRSR